MKYLIYGAYGYTGRLIAYEALQRGHDIMLAGRDRQKIQELSKSLHRPGEVFSLDDHASLVRVLKKVDAVLHCAGPFSKTAAPMIKACLATGKHYVDITGEISVFEYVASWNEKAKAAGVVLMPGSGFDVVPTDCLALHLKNLMPDASRLEMGFQSNSGFSRGTALTMTENLSRGGAIRRNGKIVKVRNAYRTRQWEVKGKLLSFVSIPWGDVSTAYHSTGIPNIIIYNAMSPGMMRRLKNINWFTLLLRLGIIQYFMKRKIRKSVTGPDEQLRNAASTFIWGEVTNEKGDTIHAHLETPEGYKLTAQTAVEIMERICNGEVKPGFQTPASAFGSDFILRFENVKGFGS
ncbi:MAG: saccharopine dehydrogenase NADP-binding domain-containing protein [Cyclobacteriaceae bacterium]|nr:saccharopine dehydrogenase NADP-binding domain-containing protein [Cyclobacteriaceae bacterium]